MATLSTGERANLMALEMIQRQLVQLTLAVATNAAGNGPAPGPAAPRGPAAGPARRNLLGRATDLLVGRFTALLGPLVAFGTYLNAPTSGLSVFNKAMGLFAASVAPLLLPVLFTLSVGLAAAGDVVFRKLIPAMESFDRAVVQTGIPAVVQLAETAGKAADALSFLATSDVGRALGADAGGGRVGGLNRTIDRALAIAGAGENPDRGLSPLTAGGRAAADLFGAAGTTSPLLSAPAALAGGAASWLSRSLGFDPDAAHAAARPTGDAAGARGAADKARLDALRELQLAMLPKVSNGGGGQSTFDRALQAAAGASPWEREMLLKMGEVVTIMSRALERGGGTGTLTDDERRRVDRVAEDARRGRR